jgi:SulP family sulfate permease
MPFRDHDRSGSTSMQLPVMRWRDHWHWPGALRADALAGLTGAVVVLPQGVAFATLAGVPPLYGLYAALLPCVVASLFGSSRLMVIGPANAISLTTMALLAQRFRASTRR